ncbi:zinc ABC transporter permease subunit ZnuB [Geopsychrobacter electrodiphilus]|uniref:zinc ABC transporter permease subunit ZnuB n=1 Tax=Geopsychrobacter electrodiphilus TaxID=225196 RepID=UPI000360097F|nr:zinc ABC transporter permease subunit ZnuB [Geopsychrobacter electrodiphilus]
MFNDFMLRALLAGIGVALVAGPFGTFVVWRRMAYFGDTLAHSALLGVALGFLLQVDPTLAVMAVCLLVSLLLFFLQRQQRLPSDTLLGILSHSALSLGLVAIAFMEKVRIDLLAYLFGDILAVGRQDLMVIYGSGLLALVLLLLLWRPLLAITLHEDLARVEGVRVDLVELSFSCLLALVVAIMMKVVGLLLITSLFILPAATVRRFSSSPEQMAGFAALAGVISVGVGLYGSWQLDTPAGPSIVVAAALLFALLQLLPARRN